MTCEFSEQLWQICQIWLFKLKNFIYNGKGKESVFSNEACFTGNTPTWRGRWADMDPGFLMSPSPQMTPTLSRGETKLQTSFTDFYHLKLKKRVIRCTQSLLPWQKHALCPLSSSDKSVKVWDAGSRACINTFFDHQDQVTHKPCISSSLSGGGACSLWLAWRCSFSLLL